MSAGRGFVGLAGVSTGTQQSRTDSILMWGAFTLCVCLMGYGFSQGLAKYFDFRSFYAAGVTLRSSAFHLYDLELQRQVQWRLVSPDRFLPFYHLSYEALLYVPLSWFPYRIAYLVYLGWNILLLAAVYMLAPGAVSPQLSRVSRRVLFFGFIPVLFCLAVGQNTILYLLLLCMVWRLITQERMYAAGLLLGLGLFKIPLSIVIAALLTLRLGRKFLAGFASAAVAVSAACVAITGWNGTRGFLDLLAQAAWAGNHGVVAQTEMGVMPLGMPNLYGLLYAAGIRHLPTTAADVLYAAVVLGTVVWAVVIVRRTETLSNAYSVAIVCALLVGQHVYLHDMALLLLPVLLGCTRAQSRWVLLCYLLPVAIFAIDVQHLIAVYAIVLIAFLAAVTYEEAALKRNSTADRMLTA